MSTSNYLALENSRNYSLNPTKDSSSNNDLCTSDNSSVTNPKNTRCNHGYILCKTGLMSAENTSKHKLWFKSEWIAKLHPHVLSPELQQVSPAVKTERFNLSLSVFKNRSVTQIPGTPIHMRANNDDSGPLRGLSSIHFYVWTKLPVISFRAPPKR